MTRVEISKAAEGPEWPVGWHLEALKILFPGCVPHASSTGWTYGPLGIS